MAKGLRVAETTLAETHAKAEVAAFWEAASCGEAYAVGPSPREFYESQSRARYELEPYIRDFAQFESGANRDVLEIGVGMGADHMEWARSKPRTLSGLDLTERAIAFTTERLALYGLSSRLEVGDAERLPYADASFDVVYSWGVLHHSPDTPRAIDEVWRVLRPGGEARIMVYHTHSIVGYALWARYALMRGRPWMTMADIYARYLESPGTKAYTIDGARALFSRFARVDTRVELSVGDLMEGAAGQRHGGILLSAARRLWPRALLRRFMRQRGLFLLICAVK